MTYKFGNAFKISIPGFEGLIMKENKDGQRRISSVQVIVFGFLMVIIAGAILLWLPISSVEREFTSPIDALFTATTSVCVTGLTTVTTAAHWSMFGKVVILILIQLGGLGVVCVGIGLMLIMKKKITMRERLLIQTAYNLENIDGMVRVIKNVSFGAFMAEGIGAVFYAFVFVPDYGWGKGIWYSIFHSVSAFCNAGIDLLGDSSLCMYRDNIVINVVTMLLIVTGGIGFIVWWDIKKIFVNSTHTGKIKGQLFKRLSVHSKVAIVTSLICIIGGAAVIFIAEYDNPDTLGTMKTGHKIMSSLFESVTTRTAGFATIPQELFRDTTYMIILFFMLVGGSPMGTAGGFKTTTLALIFFSVKSTVKGKKDTEVFGRKIESENIKTALAVLSIISAIVFAAVLLLVAIEPFSLKDIVFETISAMGTVGLTRGITPMLSTAGKIIICFVMFAGRIGPISLVMAFSIRKKKENISNMRELAKARILIG